MNEFSAVERELRAAAPHRLLHVVSEWLRRTHGATRVRLHMADYGVRSLQLVEAVPLTNDPLLIHDSPEGRAFEAPDPLVVVDDEAHTVTVHMAVGVRGDRVGVLSVTFPEGGGTESYLPDVEHVCEALGHEILVAERDTDHYLLARRASRLTLAAEMQWQLLPGRSCSRPEFDLGAHLEPAYAIFGDNFDWSTSADHLTLAITNGMGEGIEASLLTNLAVNAMRNARRAGLGLADQAYLADQAVHGHYKGSVYVSMLLMRLELSTGRTEVVEAGSPRAWRMRAGRVEPLSFDAQLPLGMFEDTVFTTEHIQLEPGDRLLFASDGVYDTPTQGGEHYGEHALARSLTANRLLPAAQVPRAVLRELADHRGVTPLDDDALVLCVDWHGRNHGRGATDGTDEHAGAAG